MSTCKGCYRDENVPVYVGVLMTVSGNDPMVDHYNQYDRCRTQQPHRMSECSEFLPPRTGLVELMEPKFMRFPHQMPFDWDPIFKRLDLGESIFAILQDYASQPRTHTPEGRPLE